jgi:hypothetical protein
MGYDIKVSYGVTEKGYDRLVDVTDLNSEEYLEWRSSREYYNFSDNAFRKYEDSIDDEDSNGYKDYLLCTLLHSLVTDKRLLERRIENLEKALKRSD